MNNMAELKPCTCPNCGNEMIFVKDDRVYLKCPRCQYEQSEKFRNCDEAIDAWNKRS